MRNGGLPPAYLPYSPHPDPVAAIANPKAIVSDAIACTRQEASRHQQLLNEHAARARQEDAAAHARMSDTIARALQEAAAARARQEVAAACARCQQLLDEQIACTRNNNDDDDDDDEYDDVAGRLKAYAATLFACVDDTMAEIQAMDDGFENRAAAREKALADEANERQRAAAREKASADKLRQATAWQKALADEANERRRADTRKKALADEAYEQCRADTRKKVLANEVNKRCCQPSTTVDGQPQTACRRSRPCCRVGRRHGPRAPNPQEHLLCGRQHRPRAPNQFTLNGWA